MSFNPRMLILARESRRMTQKALADASATRQASVSRAEAGVHDPLPATVEAWAGALRYPTPFFEQPSDVPPLPRTFWRKQAKLSKVDQKELEARIAIRCMHIPKLVRSVDYSEPNAPTVQIGVDAKSAVEAARYMRAQWRVEPGPIDDLVNLAESNGIMVCMLPGSKGFQGVSIRDSRKDLPPIIFISADDPTDRQRWTIAHEIGHLTMHHHLKVLDHSEDDIEVEADRFAQELLMPAHEIRHQFAWKTGLAELAQLKLHWRVSMAALIRRGKDLGRITDGQALRLWKMMSKAGYRTCEPVELDPEDPGLLREIVRVHVEELGFTEDELAQLLVLPLEDLHATYLDRVDRVAVADEPATAIGVDVPVAALVPRPRLRLVE